MPKGKEWDEDPWEHPTAGESLSRSLDNLPKTKGAHYVGSRSSYPLTTISATVIKAIRDAVREEVGNSVDLAFQKIMDRLDELDEEITRGR